MKKHRHEIPNDQKNPITEYYGYLPAMINILELGAKSTDDFIDDILVVFVRKIYDISTIEEL